MESSNSDPVGWYKLDQPDPLDLDTSLGNGLTTAMGVFSLAALVLNLGVLIAIRKLNKGSIDILLINLCCSCDFLNGIWQCIKTILILADYQLYDENRIIGNFDGVLNLYMIGISCVTLLLLALIRCAAICFNIKPKKWFWLSILSIALVLHTTLLGLLVWYDSFYLVSFRRYYAPVFKANSFAYNFQMILSLGFLVGLIIVNICYILILLQYHKVLGSMQEQTEYLDNYSTLDSEVFKNSPQITPTYSSQPKSTSTRVNKQWVDLVWKFTLMLVLLDLTTIPVIFVMLQELSEDKIRSYIPSAIYAFSSILFSAANPIILALVHDDTRICIAKLYDSISS